MKNFIFLAASYLVISTSSVGASGTGAFHAPNGVQGPLSLPSLQSTEPRLHNASSINWISLGRWGILHIYYFFNPRRDDQIRFRVRNMGNRQVRIGSLIGDYTCRNGSVERGRVYISWNLGVGEAYAHTGYYTFCSHGGGISAFQLNECTDASGTCDIFN